jgi:homoserine dehydrogenase
VLAKIATILGENGISISGVMQKEEDKDVVPVVVITHKAKQRDLSNAFKEIKEYDAVKDQPVYMMIEDL